MTNATPHATASVEDSGQMATAEELSFLKVEKGLSARFALALEAQRALRRRQPRDRNTERRARHIVEPDLLEEADRERIAAMLAADAKREIRPHRAAAPAPQIGRANV